MQFARMHGEVGRHNIIIDHETSLATNAPRVHDGDGLRLVDGAGGLRSGEELAVEEVPPVACAEVVVQDEVVHVDKREAVPHDGLHVLGALDERARRGRDARRRVRHVEHVVVALEEAADDLPRVEHQTEHHERPRQLDHRCEGTVYFIVGGRRDSGAALLFSLVLVSCGKGDLAVGNLYVR